MIRLSKSGGRRRQLFGSLRWQLLSRSLLILAVLLVLIGLFQYVFMRQFTYHNKAESLRNQALSIPPEAWRQAGVPVQNNGYRSGWKAVRVRSQDGGPPPVVFMPGVTIAFIDKNGAYSVLSEWKSAGAAPRLPDETYNSVLQSNPALLRDGTEYEVVRNADGEEQIVVLHPIQLSGSVKGIVQISARTGPMKEELGRQLLIFIVLAIFALLAGLLTFLPVLKRTLHPLSNMVHAVETSMRAIWTNGSARIKANKKSIGLRYRSIGCWSGFARHSKQRRKQKNKCVNSWRMRRTSFALR